jgi:hypothetical protein
MWDKLIFYILFNLGVQTAATRLQELREKNNKTGKP